MLKTTIQGKKKEAGWGLGEERVPGLTLHITSINEVLPRSALLSPCRLNVAKNRYSDSTQNQNFVCYDYLLFRLKSLGPASSESDEFISSEMAIATSTLPIFFRLLISDL